MATLYDSLAKWMTDLADKVVQMTDWWLVRPGDREFADGDV